MFANPDREHSQEQLEHRLSVVYLTKDLLFSSRVTSAAKQAGFDISVVNNLDQLQDRLSAAPAALVVDLEHGAAEPQAILNLLPGISPRPYTIAYGPHVKESLLAAAQAAGFDLVLSRGQFDKQIGQLLQSLPGKS